MVKKLFATFFIGSTALASIAGVVLGGNNFSELKAADGNTNYTIEFDAGDASKVSSDGFNYVFKLKGKTAVTNVDYETTGTISYDDGEITVGGSHIFNVEYGKQIELSMPVRLTNVVNAVSVIISGKNNGMKYEKTFTRHTQDGNSFVINVDLPDLYYDGDETDVYIDTIKITYTC